MKRRSFLTTATLATGTVAVGAAGYGLMNTFEPDAEHKWDKPLTVDLSDVAIGAEVVVRYRGRPVSIRRRSAEDIAAARAVDVSDLIDPYARNPRLPFDAPATDENRAATPDGEWLVQYPICTHLGCVTHGDRSGEFAGWHCPCHAAHFDTAGRVRRGPAAENFPIPLVQIENEMLTFYDATLITDEVLDELLYGRG